MTLIYCKVYVEMIEVKDFLTSENIQPKAKPKLTTHCNRFISRKFQNKNFTSDRC